MNIVLLTTAASISPASARTLREELGDVGESDVVTVVTPHGPPQPLPTSDGGADSDNADAGGGAVASPTSAPAVRRDHPRLDRLRRSTKVRKVLKAGRSGGASLRFALTTSSASAVQQVVARADVVVALDAESHRAGWLLARRHPGPDVVVGTAAGKRMLDGRRR